NTAISFFNHPTLIEVYDGNICPAQVNTSDGSATILSSGEELTIDPNPAFLCIHEAVPILTADGNGLITWYGADQSTVLATGISFTPTIDNSVTGNFSYFVSLKEGACLEGEKMPVTVSVVDDLTAS